MKQTLEIEQYSKIGFLKVIRKLQDQGYTIKPYSIGVGFKPGTFGKMFTATLIKL